MAAWDTIFKAYDVRGVAPDELDEDVYRRVGEAFADFTGAKLVVVGRDMRPSSDGFAAAFRTGVRATGATAVDLGLVSTDVVYFASGRHDVPGAMITASHNPAQYNGLKLCRPGARPVGVDTGLVEIREAARSLTPGVPAGAEEAWDVVEEYAAHVRSFAGPIGNLKVVADAANGMGGAVAPAIFRELPVTLIPMYFELDGTFPNHEADPSKAENLRDLQARVLAEGADLGLAFDGDADRVVLIDDKGAAAPGSVTTAMVAEALLADHPGEAVVHNLITSRAVPETIVRAGGRPIRTRVGHSFIKAVMEETGAIFGGEHSGHYYFRDNWRADSGMIAAVVVLSVLTAAGKPLSELRRRYEPYSVSGEVNVRVADSAAALARLGTAFAGEQMDDLDGLTVTTAHGWFNVRPSNTEPLLRVNVEGNDEPSMVDLRDRVLFAIG